MVRSAILLRRALAFAMAALIAGQLGCYAPLVTRAVPACELPDEFRTPWRTCGMPLNLSTLTIDPPGDYLLGPNDVLDVTVPDLYEKSSIHPLRVQLMGDGRVHLPLVGSIYLRGLTLHQAQNAISSAYANGFFVDPRISVFLAEKSTVSVLVLGQVKNPGTYELPKYQNDIGHAIGRALGLTDDAADYIEVHRRRSAMPNQQGHNGSPANGQTSRSSRPAFERLQSPGQLLQASHLGGESRAVRYSRLPQIESPESAEAPQILRIPLRGAGRTPLSVSDIVLGPGDVVVVPDRRHEVFYVVGALNTTNTVRFTIGNRERELGVGFILPRDREIDVVTAVAMAGYIDPIYSPTTVTVHRVGPDGAPFLVLVDLIKARYDRQETILVQPGDIIYLNPDSNWWWRRAIDRVLIDAFAIPYAKIFR